MVANLRTRFLGWLPALLVMVSAIPATAQTYSATYNPSRVMYAVKRANVREGPGTSYGKVGLLEVGQEVRVTALTHQQAGSWFRLEPYPAQQRRFVYAPLLTSVRSEAKTGPERDGAGRDLVTRTLTWTNARYHGETRDGKPHGRGVLTFDDGDRYEGEFRDDRYHGRGLFTWKGTGEYAGHEGRYEGDFRDGKQHGRGVKVWPDGGRYEGDFVNGRRTGRGVYTWANGNRYEGDFVEGKRTGRGTMVWKNGDRYEGSWKDNKPHDFATGAEVARAMQCIERIAGKSFRNRCNQPLAFTYCYKKASVGSTCGNPGIKEWVGKPEHYYNHYIPVRAGARFEVPYADREQISYAACPQRRSGTFYHAVSSGPGKFKCRSLYPWIPRRKAERFEQLAERARREADRVAAQRRAREQERLAAERAQRERERLAAERARRWEQEEEEWERERARRRAENSVRTLQSLEQTLQTIERMQSLPTGSRDRCDRISSIRAKRAAGCPVGDR